MVVVVVVAVLALALVGATHHLGPLASLRVRAVRLLVVAALVQAGTAALAPGSVVARVVCLALTALLVGLFLGGNRTLPGIPLIAAGLLLNATVIFANGAMPVSVPAAERAGIGTTSLRLHQDALREPLDERTRFALLADRVPVPAPGWAQVVSLGDLLVAAGVGLLLVAGSVPRPERTRQIRLDRSMALAMESTTRGSYS